MSKWPDFDQQCVYIVLTNHVMCIILCETGGVCSHLPYIILVIAPVYNKIMLCRNTEDADALVKLAEKVNSELKLVSLTAGIVTHLCYSLSHSLFFSLSSLSLYLPLSHFLSPSTSVTPLTLCFSLPPLFPPPPPPPSLSLSSLSLYLQVEKVDVSLVRYLSLTARGSLPPLITTVGGVAAQEAITALTGKFTPLQQWVREMSTAFF